MITVIYLVGFIITVPGFFLWCLHHYSLALEYDEEDGRIEDQLFPFCLSSFVVGFIWPIAVAFVIMVFLLGGGAKLIRWMDHTASEIEKGSRAQD